MSVTAFAIDAVSVKIPENFITVCVRPVELELIGVSLAGEIAEFDFIDD